jgi:O-Antigen ligase
LKYAILAFAVAGLLPLSAWLRNNPRHILKIWMLVGFLPFGNTILPHLFIAVVSWGEWPGFVKGAEISALDLLLLALYLTMPKARQKILFRVPMALYFAAVIISVLFATIPIAALFYVWQLARMFFVYLVISRACRDEEVVNSILTGMMFGLCYEAALVIWQRFVLGDLQTAGTMGHQNGLGMTTYFISFPFFALYLVGAKGWRPVIAPITGAVVAIMTVSRATIALSGAGFLILLILSGLRKFTFRIARTGIVAVLLMLSVAPYVISSFEARFSADPLLDNYDERAAFEQSTIMMMGDHPFGVGANNFVITANTRGYYDRAGVAPVFNSRSAHVHNAYLLAAAETGYLGAFTFIAMLLAPLLAAFRVGWRNRGDMRGELLLGLGVALLMLYIQLFFEWAFFLWWFQYIFAMSVGLVAGLAQQLTSKGFAGNPVKEMPRSKLLITARKMQS